MYIYIYIYIFVCVCKIDNKVIQAKERLRNKVDTTAFWF